MIAFDSPSARPSSNTSVGTRSAGFSRAKQLAAVGAVDDAQLLALIVDTEVRSSSPHLVAMPETCEL